MTSPSSTDDQPDDQTLARQVLEGEVSLFEVLIRRHHTKVCRAIRCVVRDDEAAIDDVVQQTYLRAFRHLGSFDWRSQVSTWLYRIAMNQALMFIRHDRVAQSAARAMPRPRPMVPSPEEALERVRASHLLNQAIGRVAEQHRVVFVLREVEQLSTRETAVVLGVNEGAVKARLKRSKAAIRKELEAITGGPASQLFEFTQAAANA